MLFSGWLAKFNTEGIILSLFDSKTVIFATVSISSSYFEMRCTNHFFFTCFPNNVMLRHFILNATILQHRYKLIKPIANCIHIFFPCIFAECTGNQFRCNDGTCISKSTVCDNNNDCPEGEDEANCCKYHKMNTRTCVKWWVKSLAFSILINPRKNTWKYIETSHHIQPHKKSKTIIY